MTSSITYYLDFLCEGPIGNFDIEFNSYVLNQLEWDLEHRDYSQFLTEEERAEARCVLTGNDDTAETTLTIYDEYGESPCTLVTVTDTDGEEQGAIRVRLHEDAVDRFTSSAAVALLKRRAEAFFAIYDTKKFSPLEAKGKFLGVQITVETSSVTVQGL